MRRYLREIEIAGFLLMLIGLGFALWLGSGYGFWSCGIGLFLLLVSVVYKAFHWTEYARDNKQNIVIILFTIILLALQMILAR